ncbi:hypothetical protein [Rubripirellula obstinata]|nr:hypothetical protein [Rubripirellula obstinata]
MHTIEYWNGPGLSCWVSQTSWYISKWLTLEPGKPGLNALIVDSLKDLPERKLVELNAQLDRVGEHEVERHKRESAA